MAISTIAAQTKINPSLLEGLERDDVSQWPTGIFRRAYVRDYARAIGLDPDAVVREFLELYPDSVEVLPAGAAIWPEQEGDQPPGRLGRIVTTARAAVPAILRLPRRASGNGVAEALNRAPAARAGMAPALAFDEEAIVTGAQAPPDLAEDRGAPSSAARDALVAEPDPPPAAGRPVAAEGDAATAEGDSTIRGAEADSAAAAVQWAALGGDSPAPAVDPGTTAVRDADADADAALGLQKVAQLCSRLARASDGCEMAGVLRDAAAVLGAIGLIVWKADAAAAALTPWFVHGYSDAVRARLTSVATDSANAVAAAFRTTDVCIVDGDGVTGAIVAPLVGPDGCVGVLAVEVPHGRERRESGRAFATILAAQLVSSSPPTPPEA